MAKIKECDESTSDDGHIKLLESVGAFLAIENPMTFVSEAKDMLIHVCKILLGIRLEGMFTQVSGETERKTRYYKCRKGVFGHTLGVIGVIEDHSKGTIHFHLLIYGGLSPYLLQRFAAMESVCVHISSVLDKMYNAELPYKDHLSPVFRRVLEKEKKTLKLDIDMPKYSTGVLLDRPNNNRIIDANRDAIQYKSVVSETNRQTVCQQCHRHMHTCTETISGNDGCRFCAPWGMYELTHPRLLVPLTTKEMEAMDEDGYIPVGFDNSNTCQDVPDDRCNPPMGPHIDSHLDISSVAGAVSIDSDARFSSQSSVQRSVSDTSSESSVGSCTTSDSPVVIGEDQSVCDSEPTGKIRAYVCSRDMLSNEPTLAFKILDKVPKDIFPDYYSLINPLVRNKNIPLVIWELKRPIVNETVPDITSTEGCTVSDIIESLYSLIGDVPEYSNRDSDFWKSLCRVDINDLKSLYNSFKDSLIGANGYVSCHNPILSYCTGAHNNSALLGSDQQAKGAMYYITPYLGKSKNRLLQSLGILRSSLYHTDNFQSVHPDAELETEDGIKKNPVRSVKRVLQRFVNQSNLHLELSDYQIAASLLDIPNIITTDQYSYLDPDAHMAYRTFVQMEEDARWLEDKIFSYINGVTESETPVNCTENPVIADNFVPVRRVYDLEDIKKGIGYLRTMPFPVGEDKKKLQKLVPVSSFYANRGYDLRNINLVEYCTIIDVKEIKGFSATRNKHFSFLDRFFVLPITTKHLGQNNGLF
jgi:hypothetical protein